MVRFRKRGGHQWGTPGGIAGVVQNGQFQVWNGSSLATSAQNNLNTALNSSYGSSLCNDLAWAIGSAIAFLSTSQAEIYYDPGTNLVPLSFNSGNLPVPGYMQKIGSFGDANVFYGAPVGDFSSTLLPVQTPKPARPKPGHGGRRGGPMMVQ